MSASLPLSWQLRITLLVVAIPPLLHLMAVDRIARWLARPRRTAAVPPIEHLEARVDYWLRRLPWPWRSTCLKRATVLYGLLRPAGVDVCLHIGVRRMRGKGFQAHAWLVRDDAPFLEPRGTEFQTFQVITRFPELTAEAA